MRRTLLILVSLVAALVLVAPATAATKAVSIKRAAFSPATVSIVAGDSIRWRNDDTQNHQVVSTTGNALWVAILPPTATSVVVPEIPDDLRAEMGELSTGTCKQAGNFSLQQVSSVSCNAADGNGRKYQFHFESDGSPIKVRMIRVADTVVESQLAKAVAAHVEQLKCRQQADHEGVLPRDRTAFILKCMEE